MLLKCSKCQRLYAAQSDHDPGICLYCLQSDKKDAKEEQPCVVMDWRDPLYEYACRLFGRNQLKAWQRVEEILIRLGDYRDCRQMLEQASIRKQKLYERVINDIQSGEGVLFCRMRSTSCAIFPVRLNPGNGLQWVRKSFA